jgi:hypothetical protein
VPETPSFPVQSEAGTTWTTQSSRWLVTNRRNEAAQNAGRAGDGTVLLDACTLVFNKPSEVLKWRAAVNANAWWHGPAWGPR